MLSEEDFYDRYVEDARAAITSIQGQLMQTVESPERQRRMTALVERLSPTYRDAPPEVWAATLAVLVEAGAVVAWDYYQNPPS